MDEVKCLRAKLVQKEKALKQFEKALMDREKLIEMVEKYAHEREEELKAPGTTMSTVLNGYRSVKRLKEETNALTDMIKTNIMINTVAVQGLNDALENVLRTGT